jgi:hypothetical protein
VNDGVEEHWGCAVCDREFGLGQNTQLGWNDPAFAHDCVAKVTRGVVPAQCREKESCFARAHTRKQSISNAVKKHFRRKKGESLDGSIESTTQAT